VFVYGTTRAHLRPPAGNLSQMVAGKREAQTARRRLGGFRQCSRSTCLGGRKECPPSTMKVLVTLQCLLGLGLHIRKALGEEIGTLPPQLRGLVINPLEDDLLSHAQLLLRVDDPALPWSMTGCLSGGGKKSLCNTLKGPACSLKNNCVLASQGTFARRIDASPEHPPPLPIQNSATCEFDGSFAPFSRHSFSDVLTARTSCSWGTR